MGSVKGAKSVEAVRVGAPKRALGVAALLAGLGLGVAAYVVGRPPPIADLEQIAPANVSVFLEFPSVAGALASMATMKGVAPAAVDPTHTADVAANAVASAFHVSQDDAAVLVAGVASVALVGRVTGTDVKSAWLLGLGSSGAVRALDGVFASSRVTADGQFGSDGKGYRLAAMSPGKGASVVERRLFELSTSDGEQKLVWFPARRVLALGDVALLRDVAGVIDSGKVALASNELFAQALKKAPEGSAARGFLDEAGLRGATVPGSIGALKTFFDAHGHDGDPLRASLRFVPAGARVSLSATLSEADSLPLASDGPTKLTYPERLPAETLFYVAASTKRGRSPAQARQWALQELAGLPPILEHDLGKELTNLEQTTGVVPDDLFEMAGDEAVVAVLLAKDFKFALTTPVVTAALQGLGLFVAMKVDGDAAALRVLAKLRTAIQASDLARYETLTPDGDGFLLTPMTDDATKLGHVLGAHLPIVRVKYVKKEVVVVVANLELADRALGAFMNDKDTLREDAAHTRAIKALRPEARALAWLDVGRLASLVYGANPAARSDAEARGYPVDSLSLTGDARMTSALAIDLRPLPGDTLASLDIDALNPWAVSLLTGWQAKPDVTAPTPSGAMATLADMPSCADVIDTLEHCASKAETPEAKATYLKREAELRTKYEAVPQATQFLVDKQCVMVLNTLRRTPECRK